MIKAKNFEFLKQSPRERLANDMLRSIYAAKSLMIGKLNSTDSIDTIYNKTNKFGCLL